MRWLLMALAAARATRFVTTDKLGDWTVSGPLVRWAWLHEGMDKDVKNFAPELVTQWKSGMEPLPLPNPWWGWRSKLVNGLDCPFCVGFWIGAAALLAELALGKTTLWRFTRDAAALNYVVGHASKRLDR
ncbi:hypothetical protein SEA_RASPUTIA_33 [Microbacterium phage Rasputia]|nr:hypothetical protein SEA_RASPUTIA_33 [Microbacterium phage Rasputia]